MSALDCMVNNQEYNTSSVKLDKPGASIPLKQVKKKVLISRSFRLIERYRAFHIHHSIFA